MATTEELEKEILAEMAADPVAYAAGPVNDVITIDGETRMISVPASEIFFGVESDKDVERKHFRLWEMALTCQNIKSTSVTLRQTVQEKHSQAMQDCISVRM